MRNRFHGETLAGDETMGMFKEPSQARLGGMDLKPVAGPELAQNQRFELARATADVAAQVAIRPNAGDLEGERMNRWIPKPLPVTRDSEAGGRS